MVLDYRNEKEQEENKLRRKVRSREEVTGGGAEAFGHIEVYIRA